MSKIGVIGGGISGLSATYRFARFCPKHHVRLYERSKSAGGWIKTIKTPSGGLFETGPHSVRVATNLQSSAYALSLMTELGLEDDVIFRTAKDPAARFRFAMFDGEVTRLPYSLPSAVFFNKLSLAEKLQMGLGLFKKQNHARDVSLYDLIKETFGQKPADYFIDSMTRGIYATSSKNLTVPNTLAAVEKYFMTGIPAVNILKAIGSTDYAFPTKPFLEPYDQCLLNTAKSTKAKVWSLKNGLEDMISKMTEVVEGVDNAEIYLDTSAEVIRKHGDKLSIADSNGAEHHYDQIFASANPKTLSCLLHPDDFPEEFIEVLRGFQSTQVYVTLVELKNMVLPKNPGFGFLVPSCENPDILGVIYDSCNMPEHDGRGARYTIMSTRPHYELPNLISYALGAIVDEVHVAWTHQITADIPLMNKYHLEHSEKAQHLAQKNGIKLLGNTFTGVSVNDCIYHSALAAQNYSTSLDYRERFSNK